MPATLMQRCRNVANCTSCNQKLSWKCQVVTTLQLHKIIATSMLNVDGTLQTATDATEYRVEMWSYNNVATTWQLKPIIATSMQRCKLHHTQPKSELKIWNCGNVATTLRLQPTIETSMLFRARFPADVSPGQEEQPMFRFKEIA